jgi:hypothetical protein
MTRTDQGDVGIGCRTWGDITPPPIQMASEKSKYSSETLHGLWV